MQPPTPSSEGFRHRLSRRAWLPAQCRWDGVLPRADHRPLNRGASTRSPPLQICSPPPGSYGTCHAPAGWLWRFVFPEEATESELQPCQTHVGTGRGTGLPRREFLSRKHASRCRGLPAVTCAGVGRVTPPRRCGLRFFPPDSELLH